MLQLLRCLILKTPGREELCHQAAKGKQDYDSLAVDYLAALGQGKRTLLRSHSCITRLRLGIVDRQIIDDAKLKQLGKQRSRKAGLNIYKLSLAHMLKA